jgi:hypothetical protein
LPTKILPALKWRAFLFTLGFNLLYMKNISAFKFYRVALLVLFAFYFINRADAQTAAKPAAASAQPAPGKTAASVIDEFFKKYKDDGTGPALDYFFGTNKYFNNPTGLAQLKTKLDSARQALGAYIGKELIAQKSASGSLVLYTYLVKHEELPMRFTFVLYKPHNDWVFYRFLFDDQMVTEMIDAAKIDNKRP